MTSLFFSLQLARGGIGTLKTSSNTWVPQGCPIPLCPHPIGFCVSSWASLSLLGDLPRVTAGEKRATQKELRDWEKGTLLSQDASAQYL